MIKISKLKKSFNYESVLDNINLEISKGDIYGLVGLSGVGKSTLLRCINGLETYDEGSLLVDGIEVKDCIVKSEIRNLRKKIGMIFQHFSLLERMTVYENVALPMTCWKYNKNEINQRVKSLLALIGLENKLNAKPRELSGGQKQRVAIARALTMNPEILLCDEATSALDPKTTESILELLKKINQQLNVTIVIVTHEMAVVKQVCNKIAVLEKGQICITGLVEDIFLKQTEYLGNVIGNYAGEQLLETGVNIKIFFRDENANHDILSRIALDTQIAYTVAWGSFDRYQSKAKGFFIINVKDEEKSRLLEYLNYKQIEWEKIHSVRT